MKNVPCDIHEETVRSFFEENLSDSQQRHLGMCLDCSSAIAFARDLRVYQEGESKAITSTMDPEILWLKVQYRHQRERFLVVQPMIICASLVALIALLTFGIVIIPVESSDSIIEFMVQLKNNLPIASPLLSALFAIIVVLSIEVHPAWKRPHDIAKSFLFCC